LNTCDKGAKHELLAAAWLLEQGYQVFRNVSPAGPVDLVAFDTETGEIVLIDVKTGTNMYDTNKLKPEQEDMGVRRLVYNPHKKTFVLEVFRKSAL